MSNYKTFKVSDLCAISNIDHDDLFLISDYENGNCYSKKMSVQQFLEKITKDSIISSAIKDNDTNIGKSISEKINIAIDTIVKEEVKKLVTSNLSALVLAIISSNNNYIADILYDDLVDNETIIGNLN